MKKFFIILLTILIVIVSLISYLMTSRKTAEVNNPPNVNPTITPVEIQISAIPTIPVSDEELKQIELQKQADKNFGQWQQDIKNTKPWYDKLPIANAKYFVYFDLDQNKFIAQIYDKNNEEVVKTEIINNLKNFGIDMEKYKIVF